MSRTTVDSKNNAPACAQIIPTEREVEIPPKSCSFGVSVKETREGEGIGIPAGKATINEKNEIKTENTTITAVDPKAFKVISKYKKEREKLTQKESKGNELGE